MNIIKTIAAVLSGICGFLWGQFDGLLYALIAFMSLDYISGVIVAAAQKELSSEIGFKGIAKKVLIMALVAVGHILDVHVLGGGAVCRSAVLGFTLQTKESVFLKTLRNWDSPFPKNWSRF